MCPECNVWWRGVVFECGLYGRPRVADRERWVFRVAEQVFHELLSVAARSVSGLQESGARLIRAYRSNFPCLLVWARSLGGAGCRSQPIVGRERRDNRRAQAVCGPAKIENNIHAGIFRLGTRSFHAWEARNGLLDVHLRSRVRVDNVTQAPGQRAVALVDFTAFADCAVGLMGVDVAGAHSLGSDISASGRHSGGIAQKHLSSAS